MSDVLTKANGENPAAGEIQTAVIVSQPANGVGHPTKYGEFVKPQPYPNYSSLFATWKRLTPPEVCPRILVEAFASIMAGFNSTANEVAGTFAIDADHNITWAEKLAEGTPGFVETKPEEVYLGMQHCYAQTGRYPSGQWHSHPNMNPFWSGTDLHDQVTFVYDTMALAPKGEMWFLVLTDVDWLLRRVMWDSGDIAYYDTTVSLLGVRMTRKRAGGNWDRTKGSDWQEYQRQTGGRDYRSYYAPAVSNSIPDPSRNGRMKETYSELFDEADDFYGLEDAGRTANWEKQEPMHGIKQGHWVAFMKGGELLVGQVYTSWHNRVVELDVRVGDKLYGVKKVVAHDRKKKNLLNKLKRDPFLSEPESKLDWVAFEFGGEILYGIVTDYGEQMEVITPDNAGFMLDLEDVLAEGDSLEAVQAKIRLMKPESTAVVQALRLGDWIQFTHLGEDIFARVIAIGALLVHAQDLKFSRNYEVSLATIKASGPSLVKLMEEAGVVVVK